MELFLKLWFFHFSLIFFLSLLLLFSTLFQIHGSRLLTSGPKTEWSWWCPDVWDTCMKKDHPHPNACNISCLLGQVAVLLSTWVKTDSSKPFIFLKINNIWINGGWSESKWNSVWKWSWQRWTFILSSSLISWFFKLSLCLYLCFRFSGLFLTQNEMRWIKIQKTLFDFIIYNCYTCFVIHKICMQKLCMVILKIFKIFVFKF